MAKTTKAKPAAKKGNGNTKIAAPKKEETKVAAPAAKKQNDNGTQVRDKIARRAYEFFQARGCEPGHELEDWLLAEKEILGAQARP